MFIEFIATNRDAAGIRWVRAAAIGVIRCRCPFSHSLRALRLQSFFEMMISFMRFRQTIPDCNEPVAVFTLHRRVERWNHLQLHIFNTCVRSCFSLFREKMMLQQSLAGDLMKMSVCDANINSNYNGLSTFPTGPCMQNTTQSDALDVGCLIYDRLMEKNENALWLWLRMFLVVCAGLFVRHVFSIVSFCSVVDVFLEMKMKTPAQWDSKIERKNSREKKIETETSRKIGAQKSTNIE